MSATTSAKYAELLAIAKDLRDAATATGAQITFEQSMSLAYQQQSLNQQKSTSKPARSTQLISIEKTLTGYSGQGNESVVEFCYQLDRKLTAAGVTTDVERLDLLANKLAGRALAWWRNQTSKPATFRAAIDALKLHFGMSQDGLRSSLKQLAFCPTHETIRKFSQRFNDIVDASPSPLDQKELVDIFLRAITKGDQQFARDVLMAKNIKGIKLLELQQFMLEKLDLITSVQSDTGSYGQGDTYKEALKSQAVPPDASIEQVKGAQGIADTMPTAQVAEILKYIGSTKNAEIGSSAASVASTNGGRIISQPNGKTNGPTGQPRTCWKCGSSEHLSFNCPNKLDPAAKKAGMTKAIAAVFDLFADPDEKAKPTIPSMPTTLTAFTWNQYAEQTVQKAQDAKGRVAAFAPVAEFAKTLVAYSDANPGDQKAAFYANQLLRFGQEALEVAIQKDSEFARKIMETKVKKVTSHGTQAGVRGVAVDLWPGITDYLQQIPSKSNLLEVLRQSPQLLQSMVELCIEIAIDKNWPMDFDGMTQNVKQAMASRTFGEYAADAISRNRQHQEEQRRVGAQKTQTSVGTGQDLQMDTGEPEWYNNTMYSYFNKTEAAVRAQHQAGLEYDVDLTCYGGPPSAHESLQVVLSQHGKRMKVRAVRDTGSPDTVISRRLQKELGLKLEPTMDTYGTLGQNTQTKFVGVVRNLKLQLAPRIAIEVSAYVTNDDYFLLLIGNDILNKDRVQIVSVVSAQQYYVIQHQGAVDVMPFEMLTPAERSRSKAPAQEHRAQQPKTPDPEKQEAQSKVAGYTSFEDFAKAYVVQELELGHTGGRTTFYVTDEAPPSDLGIHSIPALDQTLLDIDELCGPLKHGSVRNVLPLQLDEPDIDSVVEHELYSSLCQQRLGSLCCERYCWLNIDGQRERIKLVTRPTLDDRPQLSQRQWVKLYRFSRGSSSQYNRWLDGEDLSVCQNIQFGLGFDGQHGQYSSKVKAALGENDQVVSAKLGDDQSTATRYKQAMDFFAEHNIDIPSNLTPEDVIVSYDRVLQAKIGKGCEQYKSMLYKFTFEMDHALAYTKQEMGEYSEGAFDIDLVDKEPYAAKPYRQSESDCQFMAAEIEGLISCGIVEPCSSPWAFPALCVHRDIQGVDKRRMVVDFRELNRRTIGDAYPMPDCDSTLARLKSKRFYATIDMKSGFWQVGLTERAKQYSVFVTRDGQYRFRRMAFGLKNAPAYFQRMMTKELGDMVGAICLVYIDDVVVWGNTPEECLENVRRVMKRLYAVGLQCNGAKCCFLSTEIELLGHIIANGVVKPQTWKLDSVKNIRPRTVKDVQSILGVLGYFRKFVRGYAEIVQPILAVNRVAERKAGFRKMTPKERARQQGRLRIDWTPAAQLAVDQVVDYLENHCWIRQPDTTKEYYLYTDYSGVGIGAALMQKDDQGVEWPVAMVSRSLSPTEMAYAPIEGEALALVWALERLQHLIEGQKVVVRTDHKPLVYIFKNSAGKSKLTRWALKLQGYDLVVEFVAGKANVLADYNSRLPVAELAGMVDEEAFDLSEHIPPTGLILTALEEWRADFDRRLAARRCPVCQLARETEPMVLCDKCGSTTHMGCAGLLEVPHRFWFCDGCQTEIRQHNVRDLTLDEGLLDYLEFNKLPDDAAECDRILRASTFTKWEDEKLWIQHDKVWKIVPSIAQRDELVEERHVLLKHAGPDAVVRSLQKEFYWANMRLTAQNVLKMCDACQKQRAKFPGKNSKMVPTFKGSQPFQQWSIDTIPQVAGGKSSLIVCVDTFSKWVEVLEVNDRSSVAAWDEFYKNVVCRYGIPMVVRCDQGNEFKGHFQEKCKVWGIQIRRANVQYPQANGQAERYVGLIKKALLRYCDDFDDPKAWREYLGEVLLGIRCLVTRSHGFTPFFLLFGKEADLPSFLRQRQINLPATDLSDDDIVQYAERIASQLHAFRQEAKENLHMYDSKSKAYYDTHTTELQLKYKNGDLVLIRQRKTGGVRHPAQGPYRFVRYATSKELTAIVDNPESGKRIEVASSHLAPYFGQVLAVEGPTDDVGRHTANKRSRKVYFAPDPQRDTIYIGGARALVGVTFGMSAGERARLVRMFGKCGGAWACVKVVKLAVKYANQGCALELGVCSRCQHYHVDVGRCVNGQHVCGLCGKTWVGNERVMCTPLAAFELAVKGNLLCVKGTLLEGAPYRLFIDLQ